MDTKIRWALYLASLTGGALVFLLIERLDFANVERPVFLAGVCFLLGYGMGLATMKFVGMR